MFKWGQNKKVGVFFVHLKKLQSKISIFTDDFWDSCCNVGLEKDALKTDIDIIRRCFEAFEEQVCDVIPEYVLDGGCARLVETVALLDVFLNRKMMYGKSKDKDVEKMEMGEVMSSIHISAGKLDLLRREIEKGVGDDYKKRIGAVFWGAY